MSLARPGHEAMTAVVPALTLGNIRPISAIYASCTLAREQAYDFARSNPELAPLRWRKDREPCVLVIGADGDRLNDGSWRRWDRRRSTVEDLLAAYPHAQSIVVDAGVNVSANRADMEAGNYEPIYWQAKIWDRNDPSPAQEKQLNALLARRSAFKSFDEIFAAKGGYRPSMDMKDPDMVVLADHYDRLAQQRGDSRRAFRYGQHTPNAQRHVEPAIGEDASIGAHP